ncbi:granulocyte colony-stimulating factor isoform X1 [Loxodonta africana]|uniref:granulocyte colony-stimulating factor isoform X1 n=1 Tax=Loxodonta africana TaxID=9785 RepID=UPI0030CEA7E1
MTLSTFTILVPLLELTFSEAKIHHNWTVSEDKSLSPELACMCEEGHTLIKTLAKGRPWFQHFALLLLVWHSALWTVQEATPLGPASSLPPSFLLQCLEQVRKIRADGAVLQERLVSGEGGEHADALRRGSGESCRETEGIRAMRGGRYGKTAEERCQGGTGEQPYMREMEENPEPTGKKPGEQNLWEWRWGGSRGSGSEGPRAQDRSISSRGEGGVGLRSLAGYGVQGRPQRGEEDQGEPATLALAPHSASPHPQCATYKLCHPEELVLLGHSLGITQAPLSSCSSQALEVVSVCLEGRKEGEPTPPVPGLSRSPGSKLGARLPASQPPPNPHIVSLQVDCLHQLHSGLVLYQGLLQALAGTSPEVASTLDLLHLDVADFAINIWQQMEDMGVAPTGKPTQGPMPTFTSAFQRRAGGVLVASNLQSFLEQAYRVLRYLAQP